MRGRKYFNFKAFDAYAAFILEHYPWAEPVSPADIDRQHGFDALDLPDTYDWNVMPTGMVLAEVVRRDVEALTTCQMVCCLPGWTASLGAKAERQVARWLNLPRMHIDDEWVAALMRQKGVL
jgi:hypothetical protein